MSQREAEEAEGGRGGPLWAFVAWKRPPVQSRRLNGPGGRCQPRGSSVARGPVPRLRASPSLEAGAEDTMLGLTQPRPSSGPSNRPPTRRRGERHAAQRMKHVGTLRRGRSEWGEEVRGKGLPREGQPVPCGTRTASPISSPIDSRGSLSAAALRATSKLGGT